MAQEENYCRNPDSSGRPWCYVKGDTKPAKEDCKIPSCGKLYMCILTFASKILDVNL